VVSLGEEDLMAMINCPSCNTPAPPGAIFCDHCGFDLRTIAPAVQPVSPPPAPPAGMGEITCPVCQHRNLAGSAFCENCGAQLVQPPAAPPAAPKGPAPQLPVVPPAQDLSGVQKPAGPPAVETITGRFVIQDLQVSLPIPPGKQEIILGREDPVSSVFPDIDLDPHGGHEAGVGRRHARLVIQNGQICLEDLDSVNGTAVNRQRVAAHQAIPLKSGDEIRLGKMALLYFTDR
jgi:hypothetical protein